MAEEKKPEQKKPEKKPEKKTEEKKKSIMVSREMPTGRIIRIWQTDVPGNKNIYCGLTRIKGVSWAISNAVCHLLKLNKNQRVETLSKEDIQKIEDTLRAHKFPTFMLNRRKDFNSGEDSHLLSNALELSEELDVKRLKKIRSFRGLRHALGQPTRGQSTKAHFRENRKRGVGVKNKKKPVATTSGQN
jgi:small subunit ribosomal protein S13